MNSQLQVLQGQEGGLKHLWNLSEPLQDTIGHHGVKAKGCQRCGLYMCGFAKHAEDIRGQGRQDTNLRK